MAAIRDSGYKYNTAGNVAVDFVWGNMPLQTNDDRSGTSPVTYNATGGGTGSSYPDYVTASVTGASNTSGTITYTATNEFNAGQIVTVTGLGATATPTLTGATVSGSGTSTTVTFTTANTTGIVVGSVVTISGATGATVGTLNGTWYVSTVTANTSFVAAVAAPASITAASPVFTSATVKVASGYNITGTILATSLSTSQFLLTPSVSASVTLPSAALTTQTGTATVNVDNIPGFGADVAWGTTTDYASYTISATNPSKSVGLNSYTVPADNHVRAINGVDAFPQNTPNGGFNPATTLYATITAVSSNGTTVTYTANNNFTASQTVTITGLYNYVSAGSTQPIATQYYAKTYTTASAFNLSGVTVASANATTFTVTNSATDSALTGVAGNAVVTIAASSSTATVPTVTGMTIVEADRLLGNVDFNTGTITYRTTGATVDNAGTVYSQSVSGSQTVGTAVNLVVYKLPTGEAAGTQAGTFTYIA